MANTSVLIQKLYDTKSLSITEYEKIISKSDEEDLYLLKKLAMIRRYEIYSNDIYIRGLIEISNICKNDCYYCGIRKSNAHVSRYALSADDIYVCAAQGYNLGFRTFVFQGGENNIFDDDTLSFLIKKIKNNLGDVRITLSLGERSFYSLKKLKDAGADRYLLRHETIDKEHYKTLHPKEMSFDNRIKTLIELKRLGFQTGCGFMVGTKGQTDNMLAREMKFIEKFSPQMCGIGPFIPADNTPLENSAAGSFQKTITLLSIIRLIKPNILLPATTALASLSERGQEEGILAGANVIMPNLSPQNVRKSYSLYNNKKSSGLEAAEYLDDLKEKMNDIGFQIVTSCGDIISHNL